LYVEFIKYSFYHKQIQYLGHVVFEEGIDVDLEKVKAVMEWPIPKDVADIRYFMGIIGYYKIFIEGFSKLGYLIAYLQKKATNYY